MQEGFVVSSKPAAAYLAKVEAEEAAVAAATTALGTAAVPIEVDGSETAAAAGEARTERERKAAAMEVGKVARGQEVAVNE